MSETAAVKTKAKECPFCSLTLHEEVEKRHVPYLGYVYKCPHCGSTIWESDQDPYFPYWDY